MNDRTTPRPTDDPDVIRVDRPTDMTDLDWALKKEAIREELDRLVSEAHAETLEACFALDHDTSGSES